MRQRIQGLAVTLALMVAATGAHAMGFGRVQSAAVLGHPLNLSVPVRLDADESLGSECATAEVLSGENRLPAGVVLTSLEPAADGSGWTVHVRTAVPIDEPVVTVTVGVGCPPRMSRRFVAFADPPGVELAHTQAEPAAAPAAAAPEAAPAPAPAPVAAAPRAPAVAAAPAAAKPRPIRHRRARTAVAAASAPAAPAPAASQAKAPVVAAASAPARNAAPRLRLDPLEPGTTPVAAAASGAKEASPEIAAAQAAASAAQMAASAADLRVKSLESSLARLRAEAQANRDALAQMERRMQGGPGSAWLPWLVGLMAVLVVGAGWLAWRLRQLQNERRRGQWWRSELPEEAAPPAEGSQPMGLSAPIPVAEATSVFPPMPPAPVSAPSVPPIAPPTVPAPPPEAPRRAARPVPAPSRRPLSVEEHFDLEQQAEFFLVLGQEEAAIDLLLTHLRGTGGTSPMPYLKLMQIYRKRGDEQAYERTRERFHQRFNAQAPGWAVDVEQKRSLQDYPESLADIERHWAAPLDAMALIEAMMFRRGDEAERFELPAYEELLFLYWLARERLQEESPKENVDVLLPIEDSGHGGIEELPPTTSAPLPKLDEGTIDLDLSTRPGADGPDAVPPKSP